MICQYQTTLTGLCPVDDSNDVYDVTFESYSMIPVEDILTAMRSYNGFQQFQEQTTAELARTLKCRVTTVGFHSGVKTTVSAP